MPELREEDVVEALAAVLGLGEFDPRAVVTAALAGLRHICDRHGLCFGDFDRFALQRCLKELRHDRG